MRYQWQQHLIGWLVSANLFLLCNIILCLVSCCAYRLYEILGQGAIIPIILGQGHFLGQGQFNERGQFCNSGLLVHLTESPSKNLSKLGGKIMKQCNITIKPNHSVCCLQTHFMFNSQQSIYTIQNKNKSTIIIKFQKGDFYMVNGICCIKKYKHLVLYHLLVEDVIQKPFPIL